MTCPSALDLALHADGVTLLDGHIAHCPACRATVEALRAENAALAAALSMPLAWTPAPPAPAFARNAAVTLALFWLLGGQVRVPHLSALFPSVELLTALAMLLTLGALALIVPRRIALPVLLLLAIAPAHALTHRMAKTVLIEGVIRDNVSVFAQAVQITGVVEGNVYVFAESLDIAPGAHITGSVFATGDRLTIESSARITGSVYAAADTLRVLGAIGGALRFGGNRLMVDPSARIAGPVSAEVDDPALVRAPAGSSIHSGRDRFTDPIWYLLKLSVLVFAFLIAWLAERLFPNFLHHAARAAGHWWRSLGAGILAALAFPLALTIGLPLAAILAAIYTAAIYGAKILIAGLAGRSLLPAARATPRLAAGLALVFTACELPFGIGIAAWLAVSLVGLGAFAYGLRAVAYAGRPTYLA